MDEGRFVYGKANRNEIGAVNGGLRNYYPGRQLIIRISQTLNYNLRSGHMHLRRMQNLSEQKKQFPFEKSLFSVQDVPRNLPSKK